MVTEEVTTQLNIDITQFKKALTDANRYIRMANSEFEKASAGVEGFADSADGLRAKLKQLGTIQEAQKAKVAALRLEYDRVAQEQGESSKAAQEMAIKLNKAESAAKKTAHEISTYEQRLKNVEDGTKDTTKETGQMSAAFDKAATAAGTLAKGLAKITGKAIITGIKGLAAASGALVTAFLASGEAQKEHITEMAKLDAAYKSAGHSSQAAAKTYEELYSVIGETDQAVEAAQQIALLADSEEQAAKWAEQGAAVVGKFGDALQPEMFFESANETLKLSESTAGFTQMLEGCGINVEDFNTKLQACSTTEEKQAYMLQVTEQALAGAGEAYREANAAVIENNKAQAALQEQLAGVGEAALPVTSTLKLMGAALLQDLMPNIKTFGTSFKDALGGSKTAAQDMGNAVGSMLQTLVQKFVSALPSIITVGTSIITSLVQGVASAAPQLASGVGQIVQAFMQAAPQLLKVGGDMLDKLLTGLVNNLPKMVQGAMNAIGGFVKGIQTYLPVIIQKGGELLGKLGEGIQNGLPGLVSQGLDILMNFATTLYDAAPNLIDTGISLIKNLVQGLMDSLPTFIEKAPEIISKFANIINDNVPRILKGGVEIILQLIKGIIKAIPTLIANIPKIITAIVDVIAAFNWVNLGKSVITWFKNGITNMLGAVKTSGKNVLDTITNALKELPTKLLNLGKTAIGKMRDGIHNMLGTVRSAATNVLNNITNALKSLPAKLLEFGRSAISNLATAISNGVGNVRAKATEAFNAVVNAIKSLPSKLLEFGRNAISNLASAIGGGVKTLASKAGEIVSSIYNTFASLPGRMVSIGQDVINGVISGISSMVGSLYSSIRSALSGLVDKAKESLGINSPSKVLRDQVGKWIPAGIAAGIEKYGNVANRAMVDMARGAVGAANAELSGSSLRMPGVNGSVTPSTGGRAGGVVNNFYQYNTSPKALSRKEIYRDTKNALRFATANA